MFDTFINNPYIRLCRLDKPVGIALLLLPALWGIWIARYFTYLHISTNTLLYVSLLFTIGAIIMRSAGCVINDYFDRHIDKNVERTRHRPIASGEISPSNALIFFIILCLSGLAILLQLPKIAIHIGFFSLFGVIIYPLMKRVTFFPQVFLGLTFNLGAVIGFVSILNAFDPRILWLYCAGVLITIGYDTIYAFQDIDDDKKIGVKSTARVVEQNPKLWIGFCYGLSYICFGILFYTLKFSLFNHAMLIALYAMTAWIIWNWQPKDKKNTLDVFKGNVFLLSFILLIIF